MKLERVVVVVRRNSPQGLELKDNLTDWFRPKGVEVVEEDPDLVISLGGDGTMLRAAQVAHRADVPLLGVNFGSLGYLTEVDPGEEIPALERIVAGRHSIEERMMLACRTGTDSYIGLNEVLVERSSPHRLVRLGVRIGGEHLAAFNADGVMVSTPTGSTAYALSAGGPVVDPRAQCLLVVPVSAHMIFARPFVVSPDVEVEITVESRAQPAELSLDGTMGCQLSPGTKVEVSRHPRALKLVKLSGPGFIERLRIKLKLPG